MCFSNLCPFTRHTLSFCPHHVSRMHKPFPQPATKSAAILTGSLSVQCQSACSKTITNGHFRQVKEDKNSHRFTARVKRYYKFEFEKHAKNRFINK